MAPSATMNTDYPDYPVFVEYGKTHRLFRDVIVTEKIDGTNAQVVVTETGQVLAGSRNRWITPDSDNFGFAAWVRDNAEQLATLGPGRHFGEWWGSGIQRGYGQPPGVRHFSLFNVSRWTEALFNKNENQRVERELQKLRTANRRIAELAGQPTEFQTVERRPFVPPPSCCRIVPLLYAGPFNSETIMTVLWGLNGVGSCAAPGFMNPEGVVVYHTAAGVAFKVTLHGDQQKGA